MYLPVPHCHSVHRGPSVRQLAVFIKGCTPYKTYLSYLCEPFNGFFGILQCGCGDHSFHVHTGARWL